MLRSLTQETSAQRVLASRPVSPVITMSDRRPSSTHGRRSRLPSMSPAPGGIHENVTATLSPASGLTSRSARSSSELERSKEEKKLWQVVLQHSGIAKNKSGVHSSRILLNRMCHPRIKATTAKCQNLQLERMLRVATYLVEVSCSTSQPSESITLITLHCMMRRLALKQTRRLLLRMKLARNLRLGLQQGRLPTHKRKICDNQIPRP